jgi:hypothetical protein
MFTSRMWFLRLLPALGSSTPTRLGGFQPETIAGQVPGEIFVNLPVGIGIEEPEFAFV